MINKKVTIVMYHYVRNIANSRYPNIRGLEINLFEHQIDFFRSNYNMITAEQLILAVKDKSYNLPDKALLLTFDDGYIDGYTNVFPILKKNELFAFFSVPSEILQEGRVMEVNKIHFILASIDENILLLMLFSKLNYYRGQEFDFPENDELYNTYAIPNRFDNKNVMFIKTMLQNSLPRQLRTIIINEIFKERITISENIFAKELYMSYEQMKLMKNEGMSFGIHGCSHIYLGKAELLEMKNDIVKSLDFFDKFIDKNEWIMCYPFGSFNSNVLEFIKNKGCILGFTTEVGVADLTNNCILTLPRLDTNDFPPKSQNYKNYITQITSRT